MSGAMLPRITLIGYRACGKTYLAERLARRLGWSWADVDAAVVARAGRPIAELFREAGEEAFRALERDCLADLLARPEPTVLATGGGVVLDPANRARLARQGGLVVWLRAGPEVVRERLRGDGGVRPSLTGRGLLEEVEAVLAAREPLYAQCADVTIDAAAAVEAKLAQLVTIVENRSETT
ncbi:MAG: shikimate kinase [Planctomycetota bacterium]